MSAPGRSANRSHRALTSPLLILLAAGLPLACAQRAAGQPATQPAGQVRPAADKTMLEMPDEARWFHNVRQMTNAEMGLDAAGEAYFAPDMKRISFQAYPKGKTAYQIYLMNLDGTGLKMVSTGAGACTCSYFHPDGTRLIFAANHHDQRPAVMPEEVKQKATKIGMRSYQWQYYPGMDIFEYTFASGQMKRLTDADGYDAEDAYSPDGKSIVFSSFRTDNLEVFIMDADGKNPRQITHAPGFNGGPFFSPDGQRVMYRADRKGDGESMQVFTNNLEGTDERVVTPLEDRILNWCPFWHPSGKWIIFTRADHSAMPPNYDLWIMRADGSQKMRVTTHAAADVLPVFSPDGKKLMWTSKRGGLPAAQIFVADFVGLTPAGELVESKGGQ
jgi:TolB protein